MPWYQIDMRHSVASHLHEEPDPVDPVVIAGRISGPSPLVSIVIDNYNYGRFLRDAVDSALGQTYGHVEVIVVDDGSTDDSAAIIGSYGNRIVGLLKENGGQASAFNAGFSLARGEIVLFLDSDDVLLPDTVQRVVNAFCDAPSIAKVQYRVSVIDSSGADVGLTVPPAHVPLPSGDLRRPVLSFPDDVPYPPVSGHAFAAWVLQYILPVPEDGYGRYLADIYLFSLASLFGTVVSLPEIGALYRRHTNNQFLRHSLSLEQTRDVIVRTSCTHQFIGRWAGVLGLHGPTGEQGPLPSVTFVAHRLISLKLEPGLHPLQDDRISSLVRQGVTAAWRRFDVHPVLRGLYAAWFPLLAFSPPWLVRRLAEFAFYPETRGPLARVVGVLR